MILKIRIAENAGYFEIDGYYVLFYNFTDTTFTNIVLSRHKNHRLNNKYENICA